MVSALISMTGFGSAFGKVAGLKYSFDVRCTNGRFLDVSCKLPRELLRFESDIRESLQSVFKRGRIEVFSERIGSSADQLDISFNQKLAFQLAARYKSMAKAIDCESDDAAEVILREVLSRREVLDLVAEGMFQKVDKSSILKIVRRAASQAQSARVREGKALSKQISKCLLRIIKFKGEIGKRLAERIREIKSCSIGKPSKGKSRSESSDRIVELVDKIDVSEEISRLNSHIGMFRELERGKPQGKKIDFILQEMMREVNTIGSKVQDAKIQRFVIEAKNEVERIREQIQNVE